jgi:hypothetical protein
MAGKKRIRGARSLLRSMRMQIGGVLADPLIAELMDAQIARAIAHERNPPRARAKSLAALVRQLENEKEPVERAKRPATAADIARVEKSIGWKLPAPYRSLLTTLNHVEIQNVHLFGIAPKRPRADVLSWRRYLRKELAMLVEDRSEPTIHAWCAAARNALPVVLIGPNESFLYGEALLLDERGRYMQVGRGYFVDANDLPTPEPARFNLERFVIRAIEARV